MHYMSLWSAIRVLFIQREGCYWQAVHPQWVGGDFWTRRSGFFHENGRSSVTNVENQSSEGEQEGLKIYSSEYDSLTMLTFRWWVWWMRKNFKNSFTYLRSSLFLDGKQWEWIKDIIGFGKIKFNYRTRVRSLFTLVTDSLTNRLTHWLLFRKLYWCDPGVWRCQLKTCWCCNCCWWWSCC